jgi:signal transduction histidine kinase
VQDTGLSALAANKAALAERQRIYRDLHDDIGARLLQLIYAAPTPEYAEQARSALQDLRDVVSRTRRGAAPLSEVLCEIEAEARQRLGAADIELEWQQPETLPSMELDDERALHLYRIVREAVSNALKHAGARTIRVRVKVLARLLALELTDDGRGLQSPSGTAGRGVDAMRERAEQLHGAIRWTQGTAGGTKVMLSVPLDQSS